MNRMWLACVLGMILPWCTALARADADFHTPTRRDLAFAYLAFEAAAEKAPPERREGLNRDFDAITGDFFRGDLAAALRSLNGLTASLAEKDEATIRAVRSLRVFGAPRFWSMDPLAALPTIEVRSLYDLPAEHAIEVDLELQIRPRGSIEPIVRVPFHASFGAGKSVAERVELGLAAFDWRPGPYDFLLTWGDGSTQVFGDWWVASYRPVESFLKEFEETLYMVEGNGDTHAKSIRIIRARMAAITAEPDESKAVQFLQDPLGLIGSVSREIRYTDDGQHPFRLRANEYWRPLILDDGRMVPMRVYAPRKALRGSASPLVIALHGAGGDESMWIYGYANGRLRALSEEKGFLIASVSTMLFGSDPVMLDALLADLERDYNLDRSRVYAIGHSMGAIAAAGLASARGETLASVACLAGFREVPAMPTPAPMLVYAGEIDPIFPPARLRAAVESSGGKEQIEYRSKPGEGHTLMVGAVLDETIEWLFTHSKPEPVKPEAGAEAGEPAGSP